MNPNYGKHEAEVLTRLNQFAVDSTNTLGDNDSNHQTCRGLVQQPQSTLLNSASIQQQQQQQQQLEESGDGTALRQGQCDKDEEELYPNRNDSKKHLISLSKLPQFLASVAHSSDNDLKSVNSSDMEQALTEDIYSLMTVLPASSLSFWYAVCIFIIQSSVLVLVLIDLVDFSANPVQSNSVMNRMYIPVDAPMTVTVAQFLGVFLIVNFISANGDLMKGVTHLIHGFKAEVTEEYPAATPFKWYLGGVLQACVGIVMAIDLFVLLMQSTTNIGLCLNFAALHFVQDIDDVAFTMGTMGLISRTVQKDCIKVGELQIQARKCRRKDWMRRLLVLLLVIGLYIPYFIVAGWQWTGRFMCKSVYVQFGDLYGDEWSYYSGIFDSPGTTFTKRISGRAVYLSDSSSPNGFRLAYCGKERAWTFSNITEEDHCNYFIKSTSTNSFDIMDIAASPWFAATSELGDVPMDWLVLTCSDCNENICSPDDGQCVNNECVCHDGRLGLYCEFETKNICPQLGLDRRSKGDLATLSFANLFVRKTYTRLDTSNGADTLFDRPMYLSRDHFGNVDLFIAFSGYRWIIYGVPQDETSTTTLEDFLDFLEANDPVKHPLRTLMNASTDALPFFRPILFSDPIKFGTQSHDVDPSTTRWLLAEEVDGLYLTGARADQNQPIPASFLCAMCDNNTSPCYNGGRCQENMRCNCTDTENGFASYGGFACEYAYTCIERQCQNGGTCDPIFEVCVDCDPGFYGNLCQFKRRNRESFQNEVDITLDGDFDQLCYNSTCVNGGYCTSNVEACVCPDNYSGFNCEIEVNATSALKTPNGECLNGGFLSNATSGCVCPDNFFGEFCENVTANITASNLAQKNFASQEYGIKTGDDMGESDRSGEEEEQSDNNIFDSP